MKNVKNFLIFAFVVAAPVAYGLAKALELLREVQNG